MSDVKLLDLTNEQYHDRPEWSSSQVKLLPDEPWLFYRRHIEGHPAFEFKQTASMKLGTAVHDIILEGKPVVMIPDEVLQRRKKPKTENEYTYAKAGTPWDDFEAAHPGAVLCKADGPILYMVESIRNEPKAMQWLDAEGSVEQSMIYRDEDTGLRLRARPDKIAHTTTPDVVVILDIKSTKVNPNRNYAIANEMAKLQYHRQAPWYREPVERLGMTVLASILIWVQNCVPYECRVIEFARIDLELGQLQNEESRRQLADRLETNNWRPDTFGCMSIVELPEWVHK